MLLPRRSIEITDVTKWNAGKVQRYPDNLASKEPLEIRIGDKPLSVTMRTPGSGFEIVQEAIAAGLPVLASVSTPSSLAVQLARELDLTLTGFLRRERFLLYAGEERILQEAG
jgi:formate dehydrogenase accessory protein FdhD